MSVQINKLEWQTRKERINKALAKHWNVIKYSDTLELFSLTNHAVEEYPTATGPADYVFFVNGQPIAALEAKKIATAAQEVLGQSKRYSRGITNGIGNWDGYRIPFLYSSNGEKTWFLDIRDSKNRPLAKSIKM
jgi:type I restriction enzyme R subunit